MAGLMIDAVDLDAAYGFKILRDGVTINPAPVRRITIQIPGVEGELYQGLEFGVRPITIRGYVNGSSQSNMYTKILGVESALLSTYSFGSAPSNYISPVRAEYTLTIPNFGDKKFPNCSYESMDIEYIGPRMITTVAILTIKFVQSRPYTVSV